MTIAETLLAQRYRLEAKLAAGGMGTVWRATDEMLDRPVAVKLLHEGLMNDPVAGERFRREALAAAKVSHPNMAAVYDYVEDGERAAIVMELVEGETLAERIGRAGPLPIAEAAGVACAVLDALAAAHELGIVHRDIKPANILLSAGTVKITDLGIAQVPGASDLTQTGTVMATPHYVAPELLHGAPATPAADLYATGAVLYEMLTGARPFNGDTPVATAMARLNGDPAPPTTLRAGIPVALEQVVQRALASDPSRRHRDAAAMRAAIGRAADAPTAVLRLDDDAFTVAMPARPAAAPAPSRRGRLPRARRPAMLGVAVLATGALLGAGLVMSAPGAVALPDLREQPIAEARQALEDLGLRGQVETRSGLPPEGQVLDQDPAPDTELARGATVILTVSDGSMRRLPALAGLTLEEARQAIEGRDLTVGTVRTAATTGVAPGTVLAQEPGRGEIVAEGTAIDLVIAAEPPPEPQPRDGGDDGGDDDDEDNRGPGKGKGRDRD